MFKYKARKVLGIIVVSMAGLCKFAIFLNFSPILSFNVESLILLIFRSATEYLFILISARQD